MSEPTRNSQRPLPRLLIIDDDEDLRTQMKWALAEDYEVVLAQDRQSALKQLLAGKPAVVTLDLGLPPRPASVEEGFATLKEMLQRQPFLKVVVITGRGEKAHALEAVAQGACDFLHKPIQIEELKVVLKRATYLGGLEREYREIQMSPDQVGFQGILGASPQMDRSLYYGPKGCIERHPRSGHRGERHGQGIGRQSDPQSKSEKEWPFYSDQLRRHP